MILMRRYIPTERAADRYEIVEAMLDMNDERGLQCRASSVKFGGYVIVDFDLEGDFERFLREDNTLGNS